MQQMKALAREDLAAALPEADMRVLLMALYQSTGDMQWLSDEFAPRRDVQLISDEHAGFSDRQIEKIYHAALDCFSKDHSPACAHPDEEMLHRMMQHCMGEEIAPEYAPMMREQMGFAPRLQGITPPKKSSHTPHVVIVGCGLSGIVMGDTLNRLGISYLIIEKNDDVGGTWHENRYPGCGVDTPNHAYSFSFGTPYYWSRYYVGRDELYAYTRQCADEFNIRQNVRFATTVTSANWQGGENLWHITLATKTGETETIQAPVFISAVGQMNIPQYPNFKGMDDFSGHSFHSARWPDNIELSGKRIAVIGTGATAMQLVPALSDMDCNIHVFQRTAQWARPVGRYRDEISAGHKWLLQHLPFYRNWFRFTMLWRYGDGLLPTIRRDPDWPRKDSINHSNERHRQQMAAHIIAELGDHPNLLEKAMPDYPPYGKRILLDNEWFKTLKKPNVELITESIDHITPTGIATQQAAYDFDMIIYATGFNVAQMTARLNVTAHGKNLRDVWQDNNPYAYQGTCVSGFPNMFIMLGPGTGLGHGGSAIFVSEANAHYIAQLIAKNIDEDIVIDVDAGAEAKYVARQDREHEALIWTHPSLSTYYRNDKGRVFSLLPWRLVDLWHNMHEVKWEDFDIRI